MHPSISILEMDNLIVCEDAGHRAVQGVSAIVIALVAFGLPILFSYILVSSARSYQRDAQGAHAPMAKRLAEEMDTDITVAAYVIRDVQIGEGYSFLMDAYVSYFIDCRSGVTLLVSLKARVCCHLGFVLQIPKYLYWEALGV